MTLRDSVDNYQCWFQAAVPADVQQVSVSVWTAGQFIENADVNFKRDIQMFQVSWLISVMFTVLRK